MEFHKTIEEHLGWTFTGVDFKLDGNGGIECLNFIQVRQRVVETFSYTSIYVIWFIWGFNRIKTHDKIPPPSRIDSTMKRVVLMLMSLAFGVELGFKCASGQLIFALNPCHIISLAQIFLLVAPPSRFTMLVFRVHMHCLSGATIALAFPVVNTRTLLFETQTYFIQHIMMLIVPFYLMRVGGVYTPEPLSDVSYLVTGCSILFLYHWIFLQGLGVLTLVNLNNMLCPAISDPFYGIYYRSFAVVHQTLLIIVHGKLYTFVAQCLLPKTQPALNGNASPINGNAYIPPPVTSAPYSSQNGHVKVQ